MEKNQNTQLLFPNNLIEEKQYSVNSPEILNSDRIQMHNYQFENHQNMSNSLGIHSSPNLSQKSSSQKEKQQITFIKSEQKKLNEEDDAIDSNHSSDREDDDEEFEKSFELNQNNFETKQDQKKIKSTSDFTDTPKLKVVPSYTIVIKQTHEDDAFDKIDQEYHHQDDETSPNQQNLPTRTNSNMSSDQDIPTPQKNWNKIKNVLKGVQLFSQYAVETISKPSDIVAHLSPSSKSSSPQREQSPEVKLNLENVDCNASELMRNIQKEAHQNAVREQIRLIDDFKYRKKFFEAIENGSSQDILYIEEYLKNDPKRYLIVEESPDRRQNKSDTFGQTPMYCAAKNGNLEVLKLLTKYKANHNLLSYLNNDQSASDSALNAAARWGHVNVVDYLLKTYEWDQKEIKKAQKSTTNKNIKSIISKKIQ